jgi:ATP/maltotriose-dependent transcriptional regulator MalT/DNA-binding SARP family transcriptional activator
MKAKAAKPSTEKQEAPVLSKFTRPRTAGALERPRLFSVLDEARSRPAVWLAAPPGGGKTVLAGTYLEQRGLRAIWYRVTEDDADPATFFHYFGAAVGAGAKGRRGAPLPHLKPQLNLAVFTRRYFEQVCERLQAPCALVLDNYEKVAPQGALHEVLRELVDALPEGINLIVLSRGEPPPALAPLRARGAIALLGGGELRLTLEECAAVAGLRGIEMGHAALAQLHERTQGWAAGLVLALEQGGRRTSGAAPAAEATPQVVFDYFAGEIFERMAGATRTILLRASVLPAMAAHRVVELTGDADAPRILDELARANYFTLRLTQARGAPPVYQFHPLFREFLQRRAGELLGGAALAMLRRKAAALLEADGETAEALALLLAAQAWEEAAQLVFAHAAEMLQQGRGRVLEGWLRALPALERSAWALYWLGLCRLAFDPVEARAHLERSFALFEREDAAAGLFSAWASIIDTFVYEWGGFGPVDRWIAVMDQLLARHPVLPSAQIEARVACGMFMALMYRQPQRADLPRWAERAQAAALASTDVETQVRLGNQLVLYHTLCIGDVAKARLLIDAVRPRASDAARLSPMAEVAWRCVEAAYYVSVSEPELCLRAAESGLQTAERQGIGVMSFFLLAQGTCSLLKMGKHAAAAQLLERGRAALRPTRILDRAHYHYLHCLLAYHADDRPAAVEHARQAVALSDAAGVPFSQAYYRLALAHALFDQGERREAVLHLARARRIGRAARSHNLEFGSHFCAALFALESGKRRLALPPLRRALALSKASGFFNRLLWTPRNLRTVVVAALENDIETDYAQALVRKCGLAPARDTLHLDNWPFPVRIYTLGRFGVVIDGKPLQFDGKAQRKPLELLMALIASGGRNVSEHQLTEALWPDAEGDAAHQACAIALHRLRKLLGSEQAIALRRNEFTLDPAHVWVDAWAFERALSGQLPLAPERDSVFARVAALYKGPFLGQVEAPWATAPRTRLRAKFMRHIAEYGRALLACGRHASAITVFEKGLEADGQLEELYQGLMLCHSALGRRAEAIGVYQRCEKMLAATLGVTPGHKTVALYQTLQRGERAA